MKFHHRFKVPLGTLKTLQTTMSVDLNTLQPQQLMAVKQTTQQELAHLQSSYDALNVARKKYKDCISSVNNIVKSGEQEMLVPLTSSLYVRGTNAVDKFKIDIGTGYFVEKDDKDATSFFDKRINKLSSDSGKLQALIEEKLQLLNKINGVIREKIALAQQQQQQQQQQAQQEKAGTQQDA